MVALPNVFFAAAPGVEAQFEAPDFNRGLRGLTRINVF